MPLRDFFRLPDIKLVSWEEVHGGWPATIAFHLNDILPEGYRSGLKVHVGRMIEVDIGAFEYSGEFGEYGGGDGIYSGDDGTAWQTDSPTLLLDAEDMDDGEYEVRVYDETRERRLVATIEIVSPSNKDRPQSRQDFVEKCYALLRQDVCVTIVDTVTLYKANLLTELCKRLNARRPRTADATIYAATCRKTGTDSGIRIEAWEWELTVGQPLPTLPLWLPDGVRVQLDLETTYHATLRGLGLKV